MTDESDFEIPKQKPFWRCDECGFEDHKKPMPDNRNEFYAKSKPHKCPKCKSESLMPVGF